MEDKELKHEFELERVILFSDAVFAIIITIMVLEIKLPEGLRHATSQQVRQAFVDLTPRLGAYALSFLLVSAFWLRHLKIFKVLKDYDAPLVVRNLLFLFVISLFPFAVTIIAGTIAPHNLWALDVYIGIILAGAFVQTLILQYIVKHKQKLCFYPSTVEDALKWKAHRLTFILTPISVILVVIVNMLNLVQWVVYIVLFQMLIIRASAKRYYPKHNKPAEITA
ncbi:TMEM175 family protein [Mucilaginibacter sp. AW1-3]